MLYVVALFPEGTQHLSDKKPRSRGQKNVQHVKHTNHFSGVIHLLHYIQQSDISHKSNGIGANQIVDFPAYPGRPLGLIHMAEVIQQNITRHNENKCPQVVFQGKDTRFRAKMVEYLKVQYPGQHI